MDEVTNIDNFYAIESPPHGDYLKNGRPYGFLRCGTDIFLGYKDNVELYDNVWIYDNSDKSLVFVAKESDVDVSLLYMRSIGFPAEFLKDATADRCTVEGCKFFNEIYDKYLSDVEIVNHDEDLSYGKFSDLDIAICTNYVGVNISLDDYRDKYERPWPEQFVFIDRYKIECDRENLTYGQASRIISSKLKEFEERDNKPASDKEKAYLENNGIKIVAGFTHGEVSRLISKHVMEKLQLSETMIKYAMDFKVDVPENTTKSEAVKMIGEVVRTNRIISFKYPDRDLILDECYLCLAGNHLMKGKPIDDKKIAAELLNDGYSEKDVFKTINGNSPNCVNDSGKVRGIIAAAKRLPYIKKALDKERSR